MSIASRNLSHKTIRKRHLMGIFVFITIFAWIGIWIFTSYNLNKEIDRWKESASKSNIIFTYSNRYTDGSPWLLHVHLKDFIFKHPKDHRLEADEAIIYLPIWDWKNISAKFKGLIRGQIDRLSFHTEGLKLGITKDKTNKLIHIKAIGITPHIKRDFILGNRIEEVSFDAIIDGVSPYFDNPNSIEKWAQNKGIFDFKHLRINWGDLDIISKGTIALNNNLQPEGVFSARIKGIPKTIQLCRRLECFSPMEEKMLEVSLKVLSRPSSISGNNFPIIPISLQHSAIYVGSVKISDIPVIHW